MTKTDRLEQEASDHTLHVRIPPDARFVPTARRKVEEFARTQGVSRRDAETLLLAVGEALANAVEHADVRREIVVQCHVDERQITATIVDSGRGVEEAQIGRMLPLPSPLSERGRGLPIMQRCADMFSIRRLPGGGTGVVLGILRHIEENQAAS